MLFFPTTIILIFGMHFSPDSSENPFWIIRSAAKENLHGAKRNAKRLQRIAGIASK
jgi:hypothetical protein